MTDLRTAAQQALEALEAGDWYINQLELIVYSDDDKGAHEDRAKVQAAITTLRAALAEPVQEPVAWMDREGDLYKMPEIEGWAPPHTMLYAAPPQRKPLTDEEIYAAIKGIDSLKAVEVARAIEKAHGIE